MPKPRRLIRVCSILVLLAVTTSLLPAPVAALPAGAAAAQAAATAQPVVAIHVSELTNALETMPAVSPTPTGSGTSGYQWWYTSWHYFVMVESLKEMLRSDGTPFVTVSDADIRAGQLINAGHPRYPILISLASEAVADDEIAPLRAYVSAGGFLFAGSSAFTRAPSGATRSDFALADDMGLHMVNANLSNWYLNGTFTKLFDHRLVASIPGGSLTWRMPLTSEQIPWGTTAGHAVHNTHYAWQVRATDAEVIANGGSGPLLATRGYGAGRFIYYGSMQPIIGHGSYDAGMYSYTIFRHAIEWAFESHNLPIVKLSPWRYAYDAAFVIRHDFENWPGSIQGIEASAQFEHSIGARGDYVFCTGTLRDHMGDPTATVESLKRAVSLYGATIGPHNGGLVNPVNPSMDPGAYDYWHWGPDEALDLTPPGYASGRDYAYTSLDLAYQDIETWLAGVDNGRAGCGAADNCPRLWISPYFNSTREATYGIFEQLNVTTVGEQKVGPFPHWTVSTQTNGKRYPHLTLPVSEWYIGSDIAQSLDMHNTSSVRAAIDAYYDLGALINIYGHASSTGGVPHEYVTYNLAKPRNWAANAMSVFDWWQARSNVVVTPGYAKSGSVAIATAHVTGATDPETSVEIVVPNWASGAIGNLEVRLNGALADAAAFRTTGYGVKVKVGTTVSDVEVRYTPLETWMQTDWSGGPGQIAWSDGTRFASSSGIDTSETGQARLSLASGGDILMADDFTRDSTPTPPAAFTWTIPPSSTGNRFQHDTTGGELTTSADTTSYYGFAYTGDASLTDYSLESDIRFRSGSFGGGLAGRFSGSNGQRYGAWIYPDGSGGGSNVLKLIKFTAWTSWSGTPLQQVSLASVGTTSHHLKLAFSGNRIQVFYDNPTTPVIDVTDSAPFAAGYAGVDFYAMVNTYGPIYNNVVVRDGAGNVILSDDFGPEPPDPILPWLRHLGAWTISGGVLQGASAANTYGYVYNANTWTDYSVEGRIQFVSGAFGGGIGGRLDATTGTHYGAWIYPDGSSGGSNVLKLIKYRDWTDWSQTPMQQVNLGSVGTGWHTLKLSFASNRIVVYYDGAQVIDVTDTGFDSRPALASGGVSLDLWTQSTAYVMGVDDIVVRSPAQYGTSGALLSSAFDGGVGAQWQTISWDAAAGGATSARIRTRTAERADQLASAAWSSYYAASNSPITNPSQRWIQYELELASSDPAATPGFYEVRVGYVPGILLPASRLTYTSAANGDSQAQAQLSATLLDDDSAPIAGRSVMFTLGDLPAVAATTNASGVANAGLALDTPPGDYTLHISFAGDASFAPASLAVPFTVSSPWASWVQDSQTDFEAGTLTYAEAATQPGSVVLESVTSGGEESGSFTVSGVSGWGYRRRLAIDNPNAKALRAGHSVMLSLDTAGLVANGKQRADGQDLRVLWDNGSTLVELDRLAETAFNTADTRIWFKLQAVVGAGERDMNYFIVYGNPAASAPPSDPRNVWALWDTFDGSALDTGLWLTNGAVTVSDGQAHIAVAGNLYGHDTFTDTQVEIRVKLSTQNLASSAWWGWEDGRSDAPNIIVFEETTTGLQGLLRRNSGAYDWFDLTAPDRRDWHTYVTRWWDTNAAWLIDGATVGARSGSAPTAAQFVNLNSNSIAYDVDYVKARFDAAAEPIVSLATPQPSYIGEGRLRSVAYDTGHTSTWKYLAWDATTPAGTGVTLRLRTASSQDGLASAAWVDYSHTGLWITNPAARWVQYEAILTSTSPSATPALDRVTVYHTGESGGPPPLPSTFYGEVHVLDQPLSAGDTIQVSVAGLATPFAVVLEQYGTALVYRVDIPGDIEGTTTKEGAAEGEALSFALSGRVLALATWHAGTNTRLDFHPPAADLSAPPATAGIPVTLDASASDDWGHDLITFAFDCDGDGEFEIGPQPAATTTCLFSAAGSHPVAVRLTDAQGGIGAATLALIVDPAAQSFTLQPGWNLVSFNLIPPSTRITEVLASLAGDFDLVYAWDPATPKWLKYDATALPYANSLETLDRSMGFWIHITSTQRTLTIHGDVPGATAIAIREGWNLVGYPSSAARALPGALAGVEFSLVYAYHAEEIDQWKLFDGSGVPYSNDLTVLSPGWGYWIKAGSASTWSVTYTTP